MFSYSSSLALANLVFLKLSPLRFPVAFIMTPPSIHDVYYLKFWQTHLEFQLLLLYSLEFPIDILNEFFSGKAL